MNKNQKIGLKISLLFFCVLFSSALGNPKMESKYSQVEIDLSVITLNDLNTLGITVDHHVYDGKTYTGPMSPYDIQLLNANNIPYKLLEEDLSKWYSDRIKAEAEARPLNKRGNVPSGFPRPPDNFKHGSMGGMLTFSEMVRDLDEMRSKFPNLISAKIELGRSVEDRPVYVVRISNDPDVDQDKPRVAYDALTHAREPMSMMQLMYFMWHVIESYDTDPAIKDLVNSCEMYVIPCMNPDGYEYNRSTNPNGGGLWRKNRSRNSGGSRGVDLNRNFSTFWGNNVGSSGSQNSGTYRGTEPFSEPETKAVRDLHLEKKFALSFNHHSYANRLLTPLGLGGWPTRRSEYERVAKDMTAITRWQYGPTPLMLGYSVAGAVKDWGDEIGELAYGSETGASQDGFWPTENRIDPLAALVLDMNLAMAREGCPIITPVDMTKKLAPDFYADINTAGGQLNFHYKLSNKSDSWYLTVLDLQGKLIKRSFLSSSDNSFTLLQSDFQRSVYLLQVQTCGENGCRSVYNKKMTIGL